MRRALTLFPVLLAVSLSMLAGCASRSGGAPPGSLPSSVAEASPRDALDAERRRLAELFRGTPVVFLTTSDGHLRATVPRRFCFDPGSVKVRPALGAVLDRIAKS